MWCSLKIFIADKKFTKKEQELFKKNFGEKYSKHFIFVKNF